MCNVLDVSRSGYYEWLSRPASQRNKENQRILELMKNSHDACQGMCGLTKMLEDIREEIPHCSRNRAYRIQKDHQIYSVRKQKPFRVCTTDSEHLLPVADNLLQQKFNIDQPDKVWVTDITYLSTEEGTAYLAIVKDIHDKEIVGWSVEYHMRTELCLAALETAVKRRRPGAGLIHHSDRGSQARGRARRSAARRSSDGRSDRGRVATPTSRGGSNRRPRRARRPAARGLRPHARGSPRT